MRRGASKAEALLTLGLLVAVGTAVAGWMPRSLPPAPKPTVLAVPELVIVTDSTGKRISDKAVEEVAGKLAVGTWTVQAIPAPGEVGWTRLLTVGPLPTPLPVPPQPIPPQPVPPPVVEGKRAVLIIRESAESTPEFARLITSLRTGPNAAYLTSKGHSLAVLDDDSKDESDQQAAIVKAWAPFYSDLTLPVLLIVDPVTRQLVHRESIPQAATADQLIARIKEHGG